MAPARPEALTGVLNGHNNRIATGSNTVVRMLNATRARQKPRHSVKGPARVIKPVNVTSNGCSNSHPQPSEILI